MKNTVVINNESGIFNKAGINIKELFCSVILIFTLINSASSQWSYTDTRLSTLNAGETLNILNPQSGFYESVFTGIVNGTVDGHPTQFYSVDLRNELTVPLTEYTDVSDVTGSASSRILYILNNYYPYRTSYPGISGNLNLEAAAVQLAIWSFTCSINPNTVNNSEIADRVHTIISDVNLNSGNYFLPQTAEIVMDIDPEFFKVKTTDVNGAGISVNNIELSLTQSPGYLSTNYVSTVNGYSEGVEVIGSGVGIIEAKGDFIFPQGIVFAHRNAQKRKLFLAKPVTGKMSVSYDWGTLPVELTSFIYELNKNNVTLRWTTSSELNNSGFEIQRMYLQNGINSGWSTAGFVRGYGNSGIPTSYSFEDKNLNAGKYKYRLKQIDFNGLYEYFELQSEINISSPGKFSLLQNYPNPFNPNTLIKYILPQTEKVSVMIYNSAGKEIVTLENNIQNAGEYTLNWDASELPGGIYFCRMETESFFRVIKMILLK